MKTGGKLMEYIVDTEGEELVRPAAIEEIVPGEPYYMRGIWKPYEFFPTVFHHKVSWDTIKELFNTGRIYIKNGNTGQISTDKGSHV